MESRPSAGVAVRGQRIALVVLALLGAWVVGRYGGDERVPDLRFARAAAAPVDAQRAAAPVVRAPAAPPRTSVPRARPVASLAPERANRRPASPPARRLALPRRAARPRGPKRAGSASAPNAVPDDAGRTAATLEPPPPGAPSEPLSASTVSATADASSAHVTWETNFATTSQGAEALGAAPTVWTPPETTPSVTHDLEFTNLQPNTTYHLWLQDVDEWNRSLTTALTVTTAPPAVTTAAVGNGAILVDGTPFFPLTTWNTCANLIPARIALGFNLFMGEGCGNEDRLSGTLGGKAFAVVDAKTKLANEPGVIGWYYPDELDGQLSPPVSAADVAKLAVTPPPGMLTFLTLTNHFFSGAAPLAIGRSLYPTFASLADVVGFDLYPLQNWCRNDAFQSVYDAQRELESLASGKPTFQWIEVRTMDCSAALSPTPTTVAAETWLAIAGGADGIGYFPDAWTPPVGDEIGAINAQISDLAPALLAPETNATAQAPVKVGARSLNGAIYVIAVDASTTPADVQLQVDGAGDRTFDVLGESRQVTASGGTISDHFDGLGVHLYVASPDGWTQHTLRR